MVAPDMADATRADAGVWLALTAAGGGDAGEVCVRGGTPAWVTAVSVVAVFAFIAICGGTVWFVTIEIRLNSERKAARAAAGIKAEVEGGVMDAFARRLLALPADKAGHGSHALETSV